MLSLKDNETLTKTGPGTPIGKLLRRFWTPALLATELPKPDCPPVKVKLMGEALVAFRDTNGRIGLIDQFCAHRKANLFFGRNEECGLRCVYHGWKYDVEGNCVDMPSEPPESRFKEKIRLKSYPCQEWGGIIWTYMGPRELRPELPQLEWARLPDSHRCFQKRLQDCNWAQALEGDIDSAHIAFLHFGQTPSERVANTAAEYRDVSPRFFVDKTD